MGRLLTYCLSIFIILFLFYSCEQIDKFYDQPSRADNIALANQKYQSLKDTSFLNQEISYARTLKYYQTLDEVSNLDPNHAKAWMSLANGYLSKGMIREWKDNFDKALFLDPLAFQGSRGYTLLFFFKDYEKALADFNALGVVNPDGPDYVNQTNVKYLKALCYMQLRDFNNALLYFDKYLEEERIAVGEAFLEEAAYLNKGIIYFKIKDYDQAFAEYKKGMKINPGLADFHFQIARYYFEKDNFKKAIMSIELADKNFSEGNYHKSWRYKPFVSIDQADINQLRYDINLARLENFQ